VTFITLVKVIPPLVVFKIYLGHLPFPSTFIPPQNVEPICPSHVTIVCWGKVQIQKIMHFFLQNLQHSKKVQLVPKELPFVQTIYNMAMEFSKANLKAKKEKNKISTYKITTNMATKFKP